eukprot:CAMPEP_0181093548 /NCGR_PEP_ID=MMETSP1071-20121207/9509_1 /TAXON_ID=35127 /ORGANISM="Thalassiosira sp., Strain NH16" /LENGTH=1002 /DNA_ID=CAMNT_0023175799 /DNA_START=199 /DNA_END=3205 /DNA_ORIENTATION=-
MSGEIDAEGAPVVSQQSPTPASTMSTSVDEPPSSVHAPGSKDDTDDTPPAAANTDANATPEPESDDDAAAKMKKPTWTRSRESEDGTIEIEEELVPEAPTKRAWIRSSRPPRLGPTNASQHSNSSDRSDAAASSSNNNDDDDSYNTAAEKRSQTARLGSKPKKSNMSLLSSAVAHATLERCLLGVNGGECTTTVTTTSARGPDEDNDSSSSNNSNNDAQPAVDYSKQCRPGHVIDILEMRRLSSRGVPDEPPETRSRAVSAPVMPGAVPVSPSDTEHTAGPGGGGGSGSGMNKPHRSYRPLVWRVLLGYLPPRTDLWNDVLSRDRKLYDTLVQELFSSTCPAPHDVFDEDELRRQREMCDSIMGGNVPKREKGGKKDNDVDGNDAAFVIDDEDEVAPGTPDENNDDTDPPPPPAATAMTPVTPGLLSARMQQEWVRGEGGQNTIFDNQNDEVNLARISPMCAMNTPRTRVRKEAFIGKGKTLAEENDNEGGAASEAESNDDDAPANNNNDEGMVSVLLDENDEGELLSGLKESLLLPNDDDGNDEGAGEINAMFSISVGEEEEVVARDDDNGGDIEKNEGAVDSATSTILQKEKERDGVANCNNHATTNTKTPESSPGAKSTPSISITKTSSEEDYHSEGVELCRQFSRDGNDDDDDIYVIPPSDTTDEEENVMLLDEIRKDVIRTHPDLRFFLEPNEDLGQKRYAALERILFVWAKLNKGVRYVQGMNEIVGTLYFVLAHDSNEDWANEAEADTYFLFNSLMVEMRDVFVPDLDEADTGIHGRISNMITLLSLHDPEVRCHLDSVGIDPSFYSVRWLTTLLSREFLLPDTIRLWDSMFASTHKDNFLRYVSVTMVMVIRDQLLEGDFSSCLRLLQAYPPTNLDRLLESSRALWIYESQITLACHKGGISLGHALRSINPPPAIIMAYGLPGGVAPPMREQVRAAGQRGMAAAGRAANGASTTVASAGRSFFGNAINYLRAGSNNSGDGGAKNGFEVEDELA